MLPTDEQILARANEIKEKSGGSLTDAMIRAEKELTPKPEVPSSFTIELSVKPKVAAWILEEFAPTDTHTTEERLAVYLGSLLPKSRIQAIRAGRSVAQINNGEAVTVPRHLMEQAK